MHQVNGSTETVTADEEAPQQVRDLFNYVNSEVEQVIGARTDN